MIDIFNNEKVIRKDLISSCETKSDVYRYFSNTKLGIKISSIEIKTFQIFPAISVEKISMFNFVIFLPHVVISR